MKRLFNNTLFSSIDYFVLIVLNLLATPILIDNFGVAGYGAFVFLSIFSISGAMSFFDLGMEGSLMNYVARFEATGDNKKLQDTLSVSLVYYGCIGVLLGVAIYFSAGIIASRLIDEKAVLSRESVLTSISIISVNIFLQFLNLPFSAILQGLRQYVITKSISSLMTILRYLLLIIAAIHYQRIETAFLIITGITLITLGIYIFIFAVRLPQFHGLKLHFNIALFRQLFNYSSLLFVNRIIGLVCNQTDKLLIWLYLSVTSMTIYDIVARPAVPLRLVTGILNTAIIPEVARLHQLGNMAALRKLFIRLVRYAYLILLPLVSVLAIHMSSLLRLWVGETFVPYTYMVHIFLAVYLILPIPAIASTMVVGLEKVKQTIWISIAYMFVKVILSFALLKTVGLAGLMAATLGAGLFYFLPYLRAMKKILTLHYGEVLRPLAIIGAVATVTTSVHLIIRIFLADQHLIMAISAIAVFLLNIFINYRYLLDDRERVFFAERLRAMRTGGITGFSSNKE